MGDTAKEAANLKPYKYLLEEVARLAGELKAAVDVAAGAGASEPELSEALGPFTRTA